MRRLSCLTAALLVSGLFAGMTHQPTQHPVQTMSITRDAVAVTLPAAFPPFKAGFQPKVAPTTVPATTTTTPTTVAEAVVQPAARVATPPAPRTAPSTPVVSKAARPAPSGPATGSGLWWCIGNHESHNNPATNTGNGYYGAFQFSASTWNSMGTGYARADLAPYNVQLAAAQQAAARGGLHNQFPSSSRACGG